MWTSSSLRPHLDSIFLIRCCIDPCGIGRIGERREIGRKDRRSEGNDEETNRRTEIERDRDGRGLEPNPASYGEFAKAIE